MTAQRKARSKWSQIMTATLDEVIKDPGYRDLNSREKLLSFYYTHIEILYDQRAFVLDRFNKPLHLKLLSRELVDYRKKFVTYSSDILSEAVMENQLRDFGIANKTYSPMFWGQLIFLIRYWITDRSPAFEKTDELIEKSVTSLFDLIGKGQYSSTLEFGKFIVQNPMKFKWQQ